MFWNFSDILAEPNKKIQAGLGEKLGEKILVEIGFGNGEFLEYLAKKNPDAKVVGVEVSQWCVTKAARRALAAGLRNVSLIWGDARFLLPRALEKNSADAVYMNFPCPWPKRRHAERRVTSPRFAELMAFCLRRGGAFTLATDVDWYAAETGEAFAANGAFKCGAAERNPDRDYLTKYERKWRKMGRDTFMVVAERANAEGANFYDKAVDGDDEDGMTLDAPCDVAAGIGEALDALKGEEISGEDYRVVFREVFRAGDDAALVSAISVDEGFEQHYYLKIVRSGGVLRGKVDSIGHPYRTPGVRASLRHVMKRAGVKF